MTLRKVASKYGILVMFEVINILSLERLLVFSGLEDGGNFEITLGELDNALETYKNKIKER